MSIHESAKIRLGVPVYQDAHHVVCVCENTVVTYSAEAPNPDYLEAWTRTVEIAANRFQEGLLVMTIIDRRAHAPDDLSRARIKKTILRHASKINAFSYVVEGEGFGAAAMRSALSLISLAARYPFPQKVFGRVEEAVPWMLSRPTSGEQRGPEAVKLINVANSLRTQLRTIAAAG